MYILYICLGINDHTWKSSSVLANSINVYTYTHVDYSCQKRCSDIYVLDMADQYMVKMPAYKLCPYFFFFFTV